MAKHKIEQADGLNFTETTLRVPYGPEGEELEIRTGKLAKQANGAAIAKIGGTVVMAAVVMADQPSDRDFFPLMVDYREKFYASGRIPGGFFKRESRPSDNESLRARLTDRTLRPLFPDGFKHEVIVSLTVIAMDLQNPAELVAMCAASAALHVSNIPFKKPIAGVRVGRVNGEYIVNPTFAQIEESDMNLIVAGHSDAINMVEAGASEVSEADMVKALETAHKQIKIVCEGIDKLREKAGKPKMEYAEPQPDKDLFKKVEKMMASHLREIEETFDKKSRSERLSKALSEILEGLGEGVAEERGAEVAQYVHDIDEQNMRKRVIGKGIRADGRKPTEIRPIWTELDVLPSVHGSSVFTRRQTQALAVCTLGTVDDMQMVDDMTGVVHKHFYLHYNFPGFSVGEAKPPRGPGRREIGHGALAERALEAVLPDKDLFPYTIRLVIDILESNGSSSMATVCSGSMAMMDAGVPMKRPVAGIAMGLIADEKGKTAILSDIQGIEDHSGDMDFKVCGTSEGITALQMDIKIEGVTSEMLAKALEQARAGRLFILEKMAENISEARPELKPHTPRMTVVKVPIDSIRDVIGSGGKTVRAIQEETGAKIEIQDDGTIYISASSGTAADAAIAMIDDIVREIEEGEELEGTVTRVLESGAIVQLGMNKDGMIHISEIEHRRIDKVEDVLNIGDKVKVKVVEIDKARGRVRLSRKALLPKPEGVGNDTGGGGGGHHRPRRDRDDRGGRDRGRDRDRGNRGERGDREHAGSGSGGGERRRQRRPRPPRNEDEE